MLRRISIQLARAATRLASCLDHNLTGATIFEAGSFYSPLLDLHDLARAPEAFVNSSARGWDHIDLREAAQAERLEKLLALENPLTLHDAPDPRWRYSTTNDFFVFSD